MHMRLVEALERAKAEALCTKPVCTTCGAGPYRALMRAAATNKRRFVADLQQLDLSRWLEFGEPRGAMAFAIDAVEEPRSRAQVLSYWLDGRSIPVWLYDAVIFDVLRLQEVAEPVRSQWLDAAEGVAIELGHNSLIESLLWTLGSGAVLRPWLLAQASLMAKNDHRVQRALQAAKVPPSGG
jgi:hypothetical protein